MKQVARHKLMFVILVAVIILVVYLLFPSHKEEGRFTTLMPEVKRMVGLRFDPSFFYDRGVTARELAKEQVAIWHRAGVNTIFFRVYDPAHGASYRTSLRYNQETDYGKQDLLRYVLKEAHERDIKVVAWLTVLNHKGVWDAEPQWRALRDNGQFYSSESLPYPLCARQPEVQQWWLSFVDDLLNTYPELDGIDIAEPALSWRQGETCYCQLCRSRYRNGGEETSESWNEYRSAPLVDIVLETFRHAYIRGKETILTTVLPTDVQGNILPLTVLRDLTGLDVDKILSSPQRPQYISVEYMWQEYASIFKDEKLFRPAWVSNALSQVRQLVNNRAQIVAHLELSDFNTVTVSTDDMAKSLAAALEAGADGVEMYDAHLFEKKHAWSSLRGLDDIKALKKILLLYDGDGKSDARQLATLCGHFKTHVDLIPIAQYKPGMLQKYDALFYLGMDSEASLKETFLDEVAAAPLPVLWLNFNIEQLVGRISEYGFIHAGRDKDVFFDRVRYKDTLLVKEDPHLNIIRITDPSKASVLAEVIYKESKESTLPYAVRSGKLWYFADNPFSYAIEGGNYLVLADVLHEILNEDHKEKRLAIVRLEDVHPLTPPDRLLAAAHFLHSHDIPFLIALVPFYVFPEKGTFVSMSDKPEFIDTIKEMVALGGTVVLHGVTHQRTGESTDDYEFWDPLNDSPIVDRTDAKTYARVTQGLQECLNNGIYPLLWETPHYAASLADYQVFSQIFGAACERRQSANKIGTDQLLPYVIVKDLFGQVLVPENLGYVPLEDQTPEPIITAARRSTVVRDTTVGFFFHPFCEIKVLKKIVKGLREEGFCFPDIRTLGLRVKGSDFYLSTTQAASPAPTDFSRAQLLNSAGKIMWKGKALDFPLDKEPYIGVRVFSRGTFYAKTENAKAHHLIGDEGFLVKPLQVGIIAPEDSYEQIATPFRAISAPCTPIDLQTDILTLPENITLLVVSEGAASGLDYAPRRSILNFTAKGGTLLTWGETQLAQEAGIRFSEEVHTVNDVVDLGYGITVPLPKGRRVPRVMCEGRHEVLAQAQKSTIPLLLSVDVDEGTLLYSALPLFGQNGTGPYPYIMSMLHDQCLLAPVLRAKQLEVYYDPGVRENVAVEDLIKRWARYDVRVIHVGAWHEYPEWTYEYNRLIELAHQNGMLVYAWLVLPFVSPRFWEANPQWRERNPYGAEIGIDWRKAMTLIDLDCRNEVKKWLFNFLERFPFDGVNIAGLHFSGEGPEKPETLSPFSNAACDDFSKRYGFDPRDLWNENSVHFWKRAPQDLDRFFEWRTHWTMQLHREFLELLYKIYGHKDASFVVTTLDGAALPEKARFRGVDTSAILRLRKDFPYQIQFMDPGEARPWGKDRVKSMLNDYGKYISPSDIVLNINVSQETKTLPTTTLTGLPLYSLLAGVAPMPVAIVSESGVPDADWPYIARSLASPASFNMTSSGASVKSAVGVRIALAPKKDFGFFLGGEKWVGRSMTEILVPPGEHRIDIRADARSDDSQMRIVDMSCELIDATPTTRGLCFSYKSKERAYVVLSKEPFHVTIDGNSAQQDLSPGLRGYPLLLPAGQHIVVVAAESWMAFIIRRSSTLLSNGIVVISIASFFIIVTLFILVRMKNPPNNHAAPATRRKN